MDPSDARERIAGIKTWVQHEHFAGVRTDVWWLLNTITRLESEACIKDAYAYELLTQRDAAQNALGDAVEALHGLLQHYLGLANSGDCGFWDPETEDVVRAARAALPEPPK